MGIPVIKLYEKLTKFKPGKKKITNNTQNDTKEKIIWRNRNYFFTNFYCFFFSHIYIQIIN